MFNFKKMAIYVFSFLAFTFSITTTTFGVPRYAKVVVWGGRGAGKTFFIEQMKRYFGLPSQGGQNFGHTMQLSYTNNLVVCYDNESVVLNICDTVSDSNAYRAVHEFINRGTHVVVILIDIEKFFPDPQYNEFCYLPAGKELEEEIKKIKENNPNCRIVVCLNDKGLSKIDSYRRSIAFVILNKVSKRCNFVFERFSQDAKQQEIVFNLVKNSIWNYGLGNLPFDNRNVGYTLSLPSLFGNRSLVPGI